MGKAVSLDDEIMATPPTPPRAARVASQPAPVVVEPKAKKVPLQILVAPDDAKAIKRAALDADMSYSDFMISCFHKAMKA
jgi:hypothetical protein